MVGHTATFSPSKPEDSTDRAPRPYSDRSTEDASRVSRRPPGIPSSRMANTVSGRLLCRVELLRGLESGRQECSCWGLPTTKKAHFYREGNCCHHLSECLRQLPEISRILTLQSRVLIVVGGKLPPGGSGSHRTRGGGQNRCSFRVLFSWLWNLCPCAKRSTTLVHSRSGPTYLRTMSEDCVVYVTGDANRRRKHAPIPFCYCLPLFGQQDDVPAVEDTFWPEWSYDLLSPGFRLP